MPDEVEERLNNIDSRPRNTDAGKAWGAYNVKRAIGLIHTKDESDEETQRTRILISRYSVETCFGYWVPTKYSDYVEKSIQKAGIIKKKVIKEINNKLSSLDHDSLVDDYRGYLHDVTSILEENDITWRPSSELDKKYDKFLNKIKLQLDNPSHIDRATQPLISTSMPEIWMDSLALEEFSNTFFEYIEYKIPVPSNSLIMFSLIKALKLNSSNTSDTIKEELKKFLKKNSWSDSYCLLNVVHKR